jgi:hypothetical protein
MGGAICSGLCSAAKRLLKQNKKEEEEKICFQ